MTAHTTLISAALLRNSLERDAQQSWVLLDCRASLSDPQAGPAAWASGHIANAVHANLETDLAAPAHSLAGGTGGRHPLPDQAELAARCAAWGISDNTQVVAYDDAGGAFAARAWWLLRWLGHTAVAVLDGGLPAWNALAGTTLSKRHSAPVAGTFSIRKSLTRIATRADVINLVNHPTPDALLLDARALARFNGEMEPIDPLAGHIPGASCLPHTGNLGPGGLFQSAAELAARFTAAHPAAATGDAADRICYCGSGVTAAHNVLAIRHAGLPEPRLYVGSWSEWCADPELPRA